MSKVLRAWLIVAACAGVGVQAATMRPDQTSRATAGTGLILGRVVDADTGAAIAGALITLGPATSPAARVGELLEVPPPTAPFARAAAAGVTRTLTAPDGRFLLRSLPKGRYTIYASSPRYLPGAFGQQRAQGPAVDLELDEGEKLGAVSVKLWRHGSISGTVRDESGEPAVGVGVECMRRVISGGQKRFGPPESAATDDRGMFRASSIPPGDYICGSVLNPITIPAAVGSMQSSPAAGIGSGESRRLSNSGAPTLSLGVRIGDVVYSSGAATSRGPYAPPPDGEGRVQVYSPQYHAGAASSSQATVVTVKAGEDRTGIDIQLKLVPSVRISGTLVGPSGPEPFLGIRLLPADGNDMVSEGQAEYAKTTSDAVGSFSFIGIPSGQYVIKSRLYPRPAPGGNVAAALDESSLWTAAPITVGRADIKDLTVTMRAGVRVSGRVQFDGTRAQPTAAEMQRIGVRLQGADGRTSSPIPLDGRVLADGTFKTAGYPAGRYIANVLTSTVPAGWYVKSIVVNGRDASVEPLELSDTDIAGAVVTFTDRITTISGTVTGANGLDVGAEVVIFPADSTAWKEIGVVARRSRVERVSAKGAFTATGLPPGDYYVAALAAATPGDRQDPALLATMIRTANRVTLSDGGQATVQLSTRR